MSKTNNNNRRSAGGKTIQAAVYAIILLMVVFCAASLFSDAYAECAGDGLGGEITVNVSPQGTGTVYVYCRKEGTADWTSIGSTSTSSSFLFTRSEFGTGARDEYGLGVSPNSDYAFSQYCGPYDASCSTSDSISGPVTQETGTITVYFTSTAPDKVATPSFSPAPGDYTNTVDVYISSATSGAAIYYTTNGATPTEGSDRYAGSPISISTLTTLSAKAWAAGLTESDTATGVYNVDPGNCYSGKVVGACTILSRTWGQATVYDVWVTGASTWEFTDPQCEDALAWARGAQVCKPVPTIQTHGFMPNVVARPGQTVEISAQLGDPADQPIPGMAIRFYVDKDDDGLSAYGPTDPDYAGTGITDSTGTAKVMYDTSPVSTTDGSVATVGEFVSSVPYIGVILGANLYIDNEPPAVPSNPYPANRAENINFNNVLSWDACTDPDGDPVTYDVYFGSIPNPPKVSTGQIGTTYDPGALTSGGVYYWYVVATDGYSQAAGPVWTFSWKSLLSLTILSDVVSLSHAPVTVQAELKRVSDNTPVNGKPIMFYIGYNEIGDADAHLRESGTAITGKNCDGSAGTDGIANYCFTPSPLWKVGTYSIEARFSGDSDYGAVNASMPKVLTIGSKSTSMYTSIASLTAYMYDDVVFDARLVDAEGNPISGKKILFFVGGVQIQEAPAGIYYDVTAPDGWANSRTYIPQVEGSFTTKARFAGDSDYDASESTGTLTVALRLPANEPPGAPTNPTPPDGASKVGRYNEYSKLVADLSWQCVDPDGDVLTYDVFLDKKIDETTQPVTRINAFPIPTMSFTTGALTDGVTYVWKVVPKDYDGLTPTEPIAVWSFTAGTASLTGMIYYVSTAGNDSWTGTKEARVGNTNEGPWRTINKAAQTMKAGDTAVILAGNYGNERVVFANSGVSYQKPIRLETRGDVILEGDGSGNGITIDAKSYIVISGSTGAN